MMYCLTKEGMADRSQQGLCITEQVVCEICGEGFASKLCTVKAHYSDDHFTIVRCKRCGLIFVNQRLEKAFRDFCYQHEQHLVDWFLRSQSETERGSRMTLDALASLGYTGGDILDVGCGIGTFLSVARQRGYRGTGVELNEKTATYAAQYGSVLHGDFYTVDLPEASFDVVHMSQTLEHLDHPLAALRKACQLLRPGGILWVSVPKTDWVELLMDHLPNIHHGRNPFWSPEDHLYYFTPRAMRRLFALAELQSINMQFKVSDWRGAVRRVRHLFGMSSGLFLARKPS